MTQRLVCFDNITTVPRTFVLSVDTMDELYSFVETLFPWFNQNKYEIQVSPSRIGTIGRNYIYEKTIPQTLEDLYIKISVKQNRK